MANNTHKQESIQLSNGAS